MLKTVIAVVAVCLLASAGLAQDYRFDAGGGATYLFPKEVTGNNRTLSPTQQIGYMASIRMRFSERHAIELDWGHTQNHQQYLSAGFNYRIQSTVNDITGAYVFSLPLKFHKAEPFVLVGGGIVSFNPDSVTIDSNPAFIGELRQTRAAFVYGAGFDYPVYRRLAVRAQYRGLLYRAPDFGVSTLFTGANGHTAEPSVGVVFRF
ncbi:MAG: porin family protein [Acidobacteriia bacterium]|nr:porin family protein [Terriglobia bacterium]